MAYLAHGVGDLMPGRFAVPMNPLFPGGCCGMRGLGFETSDFIPGFFTTTSATDAIASATGLPVPSLPNWVLLAGGLAVVWFITQPSGSSYRAERRKLRAKYAGYRQVTRKAGSALSAI